MNIHERFGGALSVLLPIKWPSVLFALNLIFLLSFNHAFIPSSSHAIGD
jgi:ABC-type spermidine/putrescine transport system permease subunit II